MLSELRGSRKNIYDKGGFDDVGVRDSLEWQI